jgi:benzaldehyde dehydrogenase (NAD)
MQNNTSIKLIDPATWNGCLFGGSEGHWYEAAEAISVIEPATGKVLTRVGKASHEDVLRACADASAAQSSWAAWAPHDRAAIFRRAAILMEKEKDELAWFICRESGSTRAKAEIEVTAAIEMLYLAAALPLQAQGFVLPTASQRLSYARRVPCGVVGVISPFNFPLVLSMRVIAPALAVGNAVVVKPDPQTPVSGGYLIARAFEEAGLPPGVLQVLPGYADAGGALVEAPQTSMISFTGSTAAGRKVGELAGRHLKKVALELGGKNTLIVLDDADLDVAASNAAFGAYFHQGQICMATGRIVAHRSIADALAKRIAKRANALRVGNPVEEGVAIGPVINSRQSDSIDEIVRESVKAGATLEAGGTRDGLFYRPTVLSNVSRGMRAFDEEIFGPVAVVASFDSDAEAVALANDTAYGLSCAVIGKDLARAMAVGAQLRCGLLHVNEQTFDDESVNPFGGIGDSGNGHRTGAVVNADEYSQWQWVTVKSEASEMPF